MIILPKKQCVALTGRNRTGPPSSSAVHAFDPPARRQRRSVTDAGEQNNTGPLGEPVINKVYGILGIIKGNYLYG